MIIYITGYGRSGTTLLRRMFYSFFDVSVCNTETNIGLVSNETTDVIVYKSDRYSPLSNLEILPLHMELRKIKTLKEMDNVKILNILRNGKDVYGDFSFANMEGWVNCMDHNLEFKRFIDMNIYFKDLQSKSNEIQELISNKFGLKMKNLFSDYPLFVPENTIEKEGFQNSYCHRLRPISHSIKHYTSWKVNISKSISSKFLRYCEMVDQREF